ncbi:NmrA/HSCARG family protein [Aspergillus candidus]|uniref:NmrA family protein n=1 Tax=Aspergillus candidus TaxID=41067 RepID=A0A2I2FAJ5_ASPCN|nr:NmrA family protein [Aspergillus candidus]PLB37646.1 NmrA family protein [Aspergillus candidus]
MTIPSASKKLVTVYGATGAQGGSVVRSLLQNTEFAVRAITRNASSTAAQNLTALGAEVVQADGWNKSQVQEAFSGSWAAFLNTNSEDPMFMNDNGPTEFDLGKLIIDGIVESGSVEHLVYSSAVSTSAFTQGEVAAKAAEMKSRVEKYAIGTGYFKSVCPVYAGWYMELFNNTDFARVFGGFPKFPDDEGYLTLSTPRWGAKTDMPVPWVAVEKDFGDIVHGVLLAPERYNGKVIPALSDASSFPQVVDAFQSATGKNVRYVRQAKWDMFGAGIPELEDQRRLFHFGELTNGKYFGDEPTSTTVPAHLKAEAAKAKDKGANDEAELLTLNQWFQSGFRQ